ncbi:putative pentatricopeptide repeat-containing protein At3g49142 [Cannabis sativa]|uniref:putative pentatricopeptide repeat-containing protein At3g49142 n=1 Tax=Cannabis sativa TaxID=3483 RepID=UPI0029C9C3EE|nr:putative pentatricopeptide repeat-containing protein At3g49142 [Cannabis sativa]
MPVEAVDLFLQMDSCEKEPDAVTIALLLGSRLHRYVNMKKFRSILLENALLDIHVGLLEEGKYYFKLMIYKYQIVPGLKLFVHVRGVEEELDVFVRKMKEIDSALHDVEEEDKECQLVIHSEKLAIVCEIMNSELRITKNLRVCGDCHTVAKLIT